MDIKIESSWRDRLQDEFNKPYFKELITFVKEEYQTETIYPPEKELFAAFNRTPFNSVKVVIIGQDPYHGPDQANGLCFSVRDGIKFPPSLRNILAEVHSDTGAEIPTSGDLGRWADQGVLLINSTLTVRDGQAASHKKRGWEQFTDSVVESLAKEKENLVFILWGAYAHKKGDVVDAERHLLLKSVHPSPLSAHRGFFGTKHFSKANSYLIANGFEPIEW